MQEAELVHLNIFHEKINFRKNEGNCPLMRYICNNDFQNLILDKAGITLWYLFFWQKFGYLNPKLITAVILNTGCIFCRFCQMLHEHIYYRGLVFF